MDRHHANYAYGRSKIDPELVTAEERAAVPPVRQAMVLDHGINGVLANRLIADGRHRVLLLEAERRTSAATSFLRPAMRRSKLRVITHAPVTGLATFVPSIAFRAAKPHFVHPGRSR